jgi:predicted HAD superfamily Cof-like phosphohydrolase
MPDIQPKDMFQDVLDFHKKFVPDQIRALPSWPSYDIMLLRGRLIQEEYGELVEAMAVPDFAKIVDSTLDLVYVLLGALVAMGVDARPIWDAIQTANMAKEGGPTRPDGKVLKPEGWEPPPIVKILAAQTTRLDGADNNITHG